MSCSKRHQVKREQRARQKEKENREHRNALRRFGRG